MKRKGFVVSASALQKRSELRTTNLREPRDRAVNLPVGIHVRELGYAFDKRVHLGYICTIDRAVPPKKELAVEPDRYATVLVAIMNSRRDFEIARDQHWYRIPKDKVPKQGVHAPILAFYQTKAFGAEKWSINYYAYATAWEIVPRIQLLPEEVDHPRAQQLYYKVHLSELRRLPHPIVSRSWRRIAFIVTHWARLESAYEVHELLHGTIWEERLWRALRRMGRLAEENEWDDW